MAQITAGNVYHIVNVKSDTALDLSGTDGQSILGWEKHDGDNQKWLLENQDGTNQWILRNVGSGKFLGIDGEPDNGLPVLGVDQPFAWDINHDRENPEAFRISIPGEKWNVDLSDHGNPNNGTPVTLWGKWQDGTNQTWRFLQGQ